MRGVTFSPDYFFLEKSVKLSRFLGVTALAFAIQPLVAAEDTLSSAQKQEVEKIVHDYLVSNPEVLVEASQVLQKKQQQSMLQQAESGIAENAQKLFADPIAVVGNPKGSVTLVEFFDYQCIHCKKMAPVISGLVKSNSQLRVIYKEFPIFGKSSDMASRAALAAGMQKKYSAMHDALINQEKRLNEELILEAAKSIGLDMNKFKADMNSKAVTDMLNENRALAEKLHLMGTPAFIVASTPNGTFNKNSKPAFVPGAASQASLEDLIKQVQKS